MEKENYKPVKSEDDQKVENGVVDTDDPVNVNEEDEAKMSLTGNTDADATKIKFSNSNHDVKDGKKSDASITIQNLQPEFSGMNKEELMKYVNDPFWVGLRWALFILFWILWIAMLVGAVIIIFLAPKCPPLPNREWWQKGVVYQIYSQSFMDTNKDSYGDLKGIANKLDYIDDLGVNTILLSPFYASKSKDVGYDVTNFTEVHPTMGTMADFDELLSEVTSRDLHLLLTFVPNHSSDEHPWFKISSDPNHPEYDKYKDYYIWANGKPGQKPPNNWMSVHGESAWQFNYRRGQFYLHQFLPNQPDLNLRNEDVRAELKNVLKFWLDRGVHGFHVDALPHLFEDESLANEERSSEPECQDPKEYCHLKHTMTQNQPETIGLLREWRVLMDEYGSNDDDRRILVADSFELSDNLTNGNYSGNVVDLTLDKDLLSLDDSNLNGNLLFEFVSSKYETTNGERWPSWQSGNKDTSRVASRLGKGMVDLMNMLMMFVKGTPICYYGDELGMSDAPFDKNLVKDDVALFARKRNLGEQRVEKMSRDPQRSPMQWSNTSRGGFTEGTSTWVALNPNYRTVNVQEKGKYDSNLGLFKKLVKLRDESAVLYGTMEFPLNTTEIFSALRYQKGVPGYLLVMNVGNETSTFDVTSGNKRLPSSGHTYLSSINVDGKLSKPGKKVNLKSMTLDPKQGVILTFTPKKV